MYKVFLLGVQIFVFAYIAGMIWYIIVIEEMRGQVKHEEKFENFLVEFNLKILDKKTNEYVHGRPESELTLASMYYGLTTLSTVGFGDYYPITDLERAIGCFIMFCGVLVMSYVNGEFLNGIDKIMKVRAEIEESDDLERFFGLMIHFNHG